jgi:hypothetical protein
VSSGELSHRGIRSSRSFSSAPYPSFSSWWSRCISCSSRISWKYGDDRRENTIRNRIIWNSQQIIWHPPINPTNT